MADIQMKDQTAVKIAAPAPAYAPVNPTPAEVMASGIEHPDTAKLADATNRADTLLLHAQSFGRGFKAFVDLAEKVVVEIEGGNVGAVKDLRTLIVTGRGIGVENLDKLGAAIPTAPASIADTLQNALQAPYDGAKASAASSDGFGAGKGPSGA